MKPRIYGIIVPVNMALLTTRARAVSVSYAHHGQREDSVASKGYELGARFERRVQKNLEDDGWYVLKSAGSKSITDLVAIKVGSLPLGIQCRVGGKLKLWEREKLINLGKTYGFIPLLAYKLANKSIEFQVITKEG
jgi:Holliday junction resolvase